MMPKHVIAPSIGRTTAGMVIILGTTADSPLKYLNN